MYVYNVWMCVCGWCNNEDERERILKNIYNGIQAGCKNQEEEIERESEL